MGASTARRVTVIGALLALLTLAILAAVALGAVRIPVSEVVGAVGRALAGEPLTTGDVIVVGIRIPRVLLAALVGACLGAAGTLYQALFRNPLADPYIIGVSAGAGLAVAVAFALGADALAGGAFAVPAAAFVGAVLTLALVVGVATRRGRVDQTSLLLGGVAISFTLAAVTSLVMVLSRDTTTEIVFWMMGGLTDSSWAYVAVVTPMLLLGLVVPMATRRQLNVMLLGEERASQLGVSTERLKLAVLGSASLLVAAAVSVAGLIAFVGLMTPHIARLILGPDHRLLLPAATLLGAVVLVLADVVARTIAAPIELPVGIVTAMLGGPFFIWLLVRGVRPG
jgi:iron complex transport system permease protein